jgi:cytoskeleton protein RodZ
MSPDGRGRIEIGAALRDARRRYGMEVREVEERTKIRARYIRALENENWESLPAPAYVRGFLRTYGQMLGLDGEMLADEYRRRAGEGGAPAGGSPTEPLLSESRRGEPRSRPWVPIALGLVGGIVVLLLVLSFLGDSDEDGGGRQDRGQQAGQQNRAERRERRQERRERRQANTLQPQNVRLVALTPVEVCLVEGADTALIDSQVLGADTEESYGGAKRYRLDIGPGTVRFVVGDERQRLEVSEPSSFEADSRGIRPVEYRWPACP